MVKNLVSNKYHLIKIKNNFKYLDHTLLIMEVNVWIALGVIGSLVFVLGLLAYLGHGLGKTMNAFLPGSGDVFTSIGNTFLYFCIFLIVIVVIGFLYLITQQGSNYRYF